MPRILHFTRSPEDWKALLADPEKHWQTGFSAKPLAHAWEAADGFPPEVAAVFLGCSDPLLRQLEPVLAVPEFKVPLPGGERASQNDLFVLARCPQGAVAIMVEGRVSESFGPTLAEWLEDASPGKQDRLAFLLRTLGLSAVPPGAVRYQLLHRTASAVLEAERFRAVAAVMLVHSFSSQRAGHADYEAFVGLFGAPAPIGQIVRLRQPNGTPLFAAWVQGDLKFTTA